MKTQRTACAGNTGKPLRDGDSRRALGLRGEEQGVRYLAARGYVVLERGFRMFRGEIDIIARKDGTLVFVEVRTRARDDFGLPDESVTRPKQRQVRKVALGYLLKRGLAEEKTPCRFDVLSVLWLGGERFRIVHHTDAF